MKNNINFGTCVICSGTGKVLLTDVELKYSWNKDRTHRECNNCGGQKMYGRGTGQVRLNKTGDPCVHKYSSRTVGRCLTEYTCNECGDRYQVDSGD
jgi:hypothetical protein